MDLDLATKNVPICRAFLFVRMLNIEVQLVLNVYFHLAIHSRLIYSDNSYLPLFLYIDIQCVAKVTYYK